MTDALNEKTECGQCRHRRNIPGDEHIACANPDPDMTGHPHGIGRGWFLYPLNFDPAWKTKRCANFQQIAPQNGT